MLECVWLLINPQISIQITRNLEHIYIKWDPRWIKIVESLNSFLALLRSCCFVGLLEIWSIRVREVGFELWNRCLVLRLHKNLSTGIFLLKLSFASLLTSRPTKYRPPAPLFRNTFFSQSFFLYECFIRRRSIKIIKTGRESTINPTNLSKPVSSLSGTLYDGN